MVRFLPLSPRVVPQELRSPAGRGQQPEKHADRRRLACPVGTEVAEYHSPGNSKRDPVDGDRVAIVFRDFIHEDRGRVIHNNIVNRSTRAR